MLGIEKYHDLSEFLEVCGPKHYQIRRWGTIFPQRELFLFEHDHQHCLTILDLSYKCTRYTLSRQQRITALSWTFWWTIKLTLGVEQSHIHGLVQDCSKPSIKYCLQWSDSDFELTKHTAQVGRGLCGVYCKYLIKMIFMIAFYYAGSTSC